jgi:hypothetical protein
MTLLRTMLQYEFVIWADIGTRPLVKPWPLYKGCDLTFSGLYYGAVVVLCARLVV